MLEVRSEAGAGATRRWDGPSNRSGAEKAESATRGARRSARSALLLTTLAFLASPAAAATISGTVFEDVNYGGGAGRDLVTSAGVPRPNARVELYDGLGAFLSFATTDVAGAYTFPALPTDSYTVRVVNASVSSSRSGWVGTLVPVQTFRTDASTGSALPVTDYVGGQNPAVGDAGDGAAGTAMDTATGVFTAGITGTAQSIAPVTLGATDIAGVDFGFNFNTIVNVNDSGQGSLRQFLANANALANPGLAQAGRTPGIDNAVFEIPGPGPYTIAPATWLPSITSPIVLDGTTQPGFSGTPIIELDGSFTTYDGLQAGLKVLAGDSTVRGLAINRFAVDGIRLENGSNNLIEGNYIGTDVSGLLDRGNGFDGVFIVGGSAGNRIGGLLPGQGNVISGNNDEGIDLRAGSANRIEGNLIGIAADGTTALGNVSDGVQITGGTDNTVTANRIAANGGLGIDLRNDGVTANDGATTLGQPNLLMDFPIVTSSLLAGTSLTVSGYVGSAPGQSTFANSSVELFLADADPSGFGEGRTLLGTLTADASGNFAGTLTVAGVIPGDRLTATATDPAGNTSEFGPNATVFAPVGMSGTVFEDFNYGGGAGRDRASAVGSNRPAARVELYDAAGGFLSFTATDAAGAYAFAGLAPGSYSVRVVNGSVSSSRSGWVGTLLPVQTFRTDAASGIALPVTDHVGGEIPALADAGNGATTLAALTTPTTTAQSVTPVTLGATDVTGVDFGYSFNVVVNVNDTGQGSLRQVMTNCDTLAGELFLALAGRPAGNDVTIFMLADGTARPGLTPAYPSLFTGGVATIDVLSQLPGWTSGFLDAQTQPGWTLDPIVEVNGQNAGVATAGIRLNGGTVRGFIINRFGGNGINRVGGTGLTIEGNWIGVDRTGTAAAPNGGDGIYIDAGGNHKVGMASASIPANRNVVSGNLGHGIHLRAQARVYGNRVGTDAAGSIAIPNGGNGVLVENAAAEIGGAGERRNVISANALDGIRIVNGGCGASCGISQNVVGRNLANTAPLPNGGAGIRVQGAIFPISTNIVADNGGPGIVVSSGVGNTISQNSTFGNNGVGIDLLDDGITLNDPLDVDTGPNDLLNFPTITSVFATGGTLTAVFSLDVPAGSYRIEFFKNPSGADPSGHGEGEVFASSRDITHPGGGTLSFLHSFAGNAGDVITATTTACTGAVCAFFGSTSEFSNAMTAVTTAVQLMSFTAVARDRAVDLLWQTGSELDNLGFHLYRGPSAAGPWTRLTSSLIPGLGSSPLGQAYSWLDSGLVNGQRYYYRLEDVDTSSVSTFHGPVSAVPQASAPTPPGGGGGGGGGGEPGEGTGPGGDGAKTSCPGWVLAAYASEASGPGASGAVSPTCTKHGDPESVSFDVVSHDASSATLELRTGGFWALHAPGGDGVWSAGGQSNSGRSSETVRVFVPGFDFPTDPRAPALPLRRALVDAVVGKKVSLVSAEAMDLRGFGGLRPSAVGLSEMSVSRDGTVRPSRRLLAPPLLTRGYLPASVARLAGTVFQEEKKSAVVEITPVRFDGSRQELVLAGRVRVRLAFTGVEAGEIGTGSRGRALPRRGAFLREVLAQLHTSGRGLHAVSYESLFPTRPRGFSTSFLRLQRQGEAVPFHVEPAGPVFGPGSVLYFFADRTTASTDYSGEVAYELVRTSGVAMGVTLGHPVGAPETSSSIGFASFETNRTYQPGLLEAPDVWLWDAMVSGVAKTKAFTLSGVDTASSEVGRLVVQLQGGSESGVSEDHHVRVSVNGVEVGEATFGGKQAYRLDASVPAGLLREGANELAITNVGDTGVYSLVFLDKFEVSYPQTPTVGSGVFEGVWSEGGTAEVRGLLGSPIVVDVTGALTADPSSPDTIEAPRDDRFGVKWVTGFETTPGVVRFEVEAGHRYVVVSREGLRSPRVGRVALSTLREGENQADYLVIGPGAFLEAATPLLERRRSEGLSSLAVSFEEIASEFGHGQPSAEAIKAFLSYAYHSWRRPSPRYVLLFGDSTDDPQRFAATSWASPLPALRTKTSYLWTASDPGLAAVNGEDGLPDLAIGRLPATTREQAETLVSKLLAWEDSGQRLTGKAVLVADNPDEAGDFEADTEDIRASFLSGRPTTTLKLRELGANTRPAILEAFDDGASLMSYVGHGGTAVWSSANVLNSWDVPSLRAQTEQPFLLTMNCLNGYFVAPNFDSLSEALMKAEGRGAIAAFSPSGLSVDGPAHQYQRALMAELTNGQHERLGDAIFAAQRDYAQTGLMPELLSVYQLLGDPAMRVQ